MAVKVIVPNENYSEMFQGVQFKNGEGIFEDEKLGKSIAETLGYRVEAIKAEKKAPAKKAPAKKKSE
ncbi:hypothetical protein MOD64_06505 [Bacillus spizizenii]|uniref:hypothetical protein n=1 Tax=Bacillus haynesii TaxID=1925021 RepID=UPI00228136D0|nr:hypothetical protein [Bacillus haynesii]MCY7797404.1 hypothetical protein [Bacillus spizizenii]MCY8439218.1 hypothetical protein [Bacillus haynesii]MCY8747283.1 hypothetical protein [Bacillus spizizenii]MCY8803681.1 hypothetical protein [Bacillus spizizenii]MCY8880695.1 hypothetical protein [Bacillus spizizenii]